MLKKYHPLYLNTHFNHPNEITPESTAACAMLADAGIHLGNQSVLMNGINDCAKVMKKLVQGLVKIRVKPYYYYQCDLARGTAHFRTSVAKGIEIYESLRGHTTGFAVPMYIIDAIGGGGKTPVIPQYLISMGDQRDHPAQLRGRHQQVHGARGLPSSSVTARSARPTRARAWPVSSTARTWCWATSGRRAGRRWPTARR